MIRAALILIACFLPAAAASEGLKTDAREAEEKVFIVNEYRYVPAGSDDDREIGHALCGTRCNALSTNYLNITEPGGWRLIRVSSRREIAVALNNAFIEGNCICIAEEYMAIVDDLNSIRTERPRRRD